LGPTTSKVLTLRLCQSLATNALEHLINQLEERILQTDQLKNASKRLHHRVDRTLSVHIVCTYIVAKSFQMAIVRG